MGSVWVECAAPLDGAARTAFADGARIVGFAPAAVACQRGPGASGRIRTRDAVAGRHRRRRHRGQQLGLPPTVLRVIAVQAFIGTGATPPCCWHSSARRRASAGRGRDERPGQQHRVPLLAGGCGAARRWVTGFNQGAARTGAGIGGISEATEAADLIAARCEADERLALHGVAGGRPASGLRRVVGRHPAAAPARRRALRDSPTADRWPSCATDHAHQTEYVANAACVAGSPG